MSDPDYDPRKLPRFDALRDALTSNPSRESVLAWVEKLEGWAKAAIAELEDHDDEVSKLEVQISALKKDAMEMRDAADELEALQEKILDLERGIVDPQELVLEVQRS